MRSASQIATDIELGRCSGIPECCIAYFIFVWMPELERVISGPGHNALIDKTAYQRHYRRFLDLHPVGYVPCPKCIINQTFVKVLRCRPGRCNHQQLWSKRT